MKKIKKWTKKHQQTNHQKKNNNRWQIVIQKDALPHMSSRKCKLKQP